MKIPPGLCIQPTNTDEEKPLTVQDLREGVLRHCRDFLALPIQERTATGLRAVVDAIVALGAEVEKREGFEARRAAIAPMRYPFAVDPADYPDESSTQPPAPAPSTERRSSKGPSIPGVDDE